MNSDLIARHFPRGTQLATPSRAVLVVVIMSRHGSLLSMRLSSLTGAKKRNVKLVLCPHCNQRLAPKTYKKHKRLYYRTEDRTWIKDDAEDEGDLAIIIIIIILNKLSLQHCHQPRTHKYGRSYTHYH